MSSVGELNCSDSGTIGFRSTNVGLGNAKPIVLPTGATETRAVYATLNLRIGEPLHRSSKYASKLPQLLQKPPMDPIAATRWCASHRCGRSETARSRVQATRSLSRLRWRRTAELLYLLVVVVPSCR
jgi:hypothetical protein